MEKIKAFSEVLRNIKLRLSYSGNRALYCPTCGSRNVRLSSKFDVWLMPKRYVCEDCGYIGPIVLEIEAEER
ncbi:MAG: hypothetical protein QXW55_06185 [Candidatus Bathyarchaeia archaeon]